MSQAKETPNPKFTDLFWMAVRKYFMKVPNCSHLDLPENATPRQIALARCDCLLDEYLRWKKKNMWRSNIWQTIALILTAITPVILLLPFDNVNIYAAATSAGAAIATGILAIHGYRENFIRYGSVWHTLQTEKFLYLTGAKKEYWAVDENKAARRFARHVEQLILSEVNAWQSMMQDQESDGSSKPPCGDEDSDQMN